MRFMPSLVNSILFPCRPINSTSSHLLRVQRTVCNTAAPKASEYITTTQIPSNPVQCILPIRMIPSPQNYHQPPSNPIQFDLLHHQRTDWNNPSTKASEQLITSKMPSNGAQKTLPMRSIPLLRIVINSLETPAPLISYALNAALMTTTLQTPTQRISQAKYNQIPFTASNRFD